MARGAQWALSVDGGNAQRRLRVSRWHRGGIAVHKCKAVEQGCLDRLLRQGAGMSEPQQHPHGAPAQSELRDPGPTTGAPCVGLQDDEEAVDVWFSLCPSMFNSQSVVCVATAVPGDSSSAAAQMCRTGYKECQLSGRQTQDPLIILLYQCSRLLPTAHRLRRSSPPTLRLSFRADRAPEWLTFHQAADQA